ncbi:MAG: porin family protein [Bacteroidota bacterium]|jgi:hypothetical protein
MLALLFVLLAKSPLQAQSWVKDFTPETYIGLHGGASLVNIDLSPGRDFNQKIGYMGGISFLHISEEYFGGLLIEIHYTQMGWDEFFENEQKYVRNLEYISIPMFWQPYFGKKYRIFATAGPEIAFLLSDDTVMDVNQGTSAYYYEKPIQNGFDFGFTGGVGLSGNFGPHKISLEARYYVGLTSLFERSLENNFDSAKNRAISFLMSYHIRLK